MELIEDARAKGADVLAGGDADGNLIAPTVLAGVTPDMRIYSEESFGPVVAIVPVDGDDEAVRVANDTEYGLAAAVFGEDVDHALEIARRIESGICHVNSSTVHDEPQMPFGGVKSSGWGRFGGRAALEEFTELRWMSVQQTAPLPDLMAARDRPPFRADHVGSLLRPPELLRAREEFAEGPIDGDELRAIEDEAIRDVVALQEAVGLRSVTDGEFRRASWHMDFIYQLDGVSKVMDETLHVQFRNERGTIEFAPPSLHVDGGSGCRDDLRRGVRVPAPGRPIARRRSSRSRRRAWSTTAAAGRRSTRRSIRSWTASGPT